MGTDTLYDRNGCAGFEQRLDGYWFIRRDGSRVSMSPDEGERILTLLRAEFIKRRTPHWRVLARYAATVAKHRAARAAYHITCALAGEKPLR